MSISIHLDRDESICTIEIRGDFDVSLSSELLTVIRKAPASVSNIYFDFGFTNSLDSTAIANLLMFYSEYGSGRVIRMMNCNTRVARLLSISGVSRLMPISTKDSDPVMESGFETRAQDRHQHPVILPIPCR